MNGKLTFAADELLPDPVASVASGLIYYPLHGNANSRNGAFTNLLETGSPVWTNEGYLTQPVNNATTALNSRKSAVHNSVLSLADMLGGEELVIACEARTNGATNVTIQTFWAFGNDGGTHGYYSLHLRSDSGGFNFHSRAKGGTLQSFEIGMDAALPTIRNITSRLVVVASLEMLAPTSMRLRIAYALQGGSVLYTTPTDPINTLLGGTNPPGDTGSTEHAGLTLGARPTVSYTNAVPAFGAYFGGNSTSDQGALGNYQARRFPSYSAARLGTVAQEMLSRRYEPAATMTAP